MKTNKKKIDKEDPFSDTLQVRKICSSNSKVNIEEPRNVNSTKKDKYFKKSQLPDYERRKTGTNLDNTGLKVFLPDSNKKTNTKGVSERMNIPRQLRRAHLGSEIKMISVDLPRFGRGQAVISSNIKREYDHEKSSNIQEDLTPESFINTLNYDQPSNLLEDARKEIDISQNQLERIQTILKNRNSEESYSLKPKWNSFPPKKTSNVNSKERVLSTLTTLNKKLNDMQEKFFNNSKTPYKSIKDFPSTRVQSISEVDITDSNSDNNVQIDDKKKILEKFHLSRMNLIPKLICEEKGTSIHNNIGDHQHFKTQPNEEHAMMNVVESNSDCVVPSKARNQILEKFNLSKIQRIHVSPEEPKNINKNCSKLSDKSQNFSTTIPDIILKENESFADVTEGNFERVSFFDLLNDSSEIGLTQDYEKNIYGLKERKDTSCVGSGNTNYQERDAERLRGLLLIQDKKSMEKIKSEKSVNLVLPKKSNISTSKEREGPTFGNSTAQLNAVKSSSSENPYFDCDSKLGSPGITSNSAKKKIFYDNFGRYSNLFDKKGSEGLTGNSVPNLSSSRFISCETMTKSGVFDETPLQNEVLKSDYLTKSFTVDSSGNFTESHSNEITKNKSDQFFNGGVDIEKLDTKNVKGCKMTKDMYMKLSKALSNSFYKLPSPN